MRVVDLKEDNKALFCLRLEEGLPGGNSRRSDAGIVDEGSFDPALE